MSPVRCRRPSPIALLATALLLVSAAPAASQHPIPEPVFEPTVQVQVLRPFFNGFDGAAAYSSVYDVDILIPLRSGLSLRLGAPIALVDSDQEEEVSLYLGNLQATLLFGQPGALKGFVGISGLTATSLAGSDLGGLAAAAISRDRLERFAEDAVAFEAGVTPRLNLDSGGSIGLRLGAVIIVDEEFEDNVTFLRAAATASRPLGPGRLSGEISGAVRVDERDGTFGRRSVVYLDGAYMWTGPSLLPELFVRVPLDDDAREPLDLSVGLRVRF